MPAISEASSKNEIVTLSKTIFIPKHWNRLAENQGKFANAYHYIITIPIVNIILT